MEEQVKELFRMLKDTQQQVTIMSDRLESLSNSLKGLNQLLKQLQAQVDRIKK